MINPEEAFKDYLKYFNHQEQEQIQSLLQPHMAAITSHETAARAAYRLYLTRDGEILFRHLWQMTINRTVWSGALSNEAMTAGLRREGQNSIVHFIATLIARGRQLEMDHENSRA